MPGGVGAPPPDPRVAPPPRSVAGAGWSFVEYDRRPSQWGRAEFEPEDMLEGRRVMKASAAKRHDDAMRDLLDGVRRYENTRFVVTPPTYIRDTALNDTRDFTEETARQVTRQAERSELEARRREAQRRAATSLPASNLLHTLLTGGTL